MNITILRVALFFIITANTNIAWSDSVVEQSHKSNKVCINIFERYLPVSTRYLLRPGFREWESSELFSLTCMDSSDCFFQDVPNNLPDEAGLITISIGHSPQKKLAELDSIKTFRFVSNYEIDALRVRVYAHQGIDSADFKPSIYLSLIYDDNLHLGVMSNYENLWEKVVGSLGTEEVCQD